MLPGLPLDGGRVLQSVLWGATGNRSFSTRVAGRAGQVLAIGMIAAGIVLIIRSNDLTSGLWFFIIAMFILPASTAETRRASRNRGREREVGIPVRDVMSGVPTALNASTPLDAAVRNVISLHPMTPIPVVDGGRITGVISLQDVTSLGLSQNQGIGLTVADVARQVSTYVIDPDSDLSLARQLLARRGIDLLLVFENERLSGTVSPSDLESEPRWTGDAGPTGPNRI